MENFITNGFVGRSQGFIIPVTTEDPSLSIILDDFSEEFRINIYCGNHYIDSITMTNYRQMCNNVSALPVYSRFNEYLGNVWSLIQEQLFWVYFKIHKIT